MGASENVARLEQAIENWNRGDLDAYLTLYDEGVRLHGYAPEPMDFAAVGGFYAGLFAAFPESKIELLDVLADGDRVSARFVQTGKHEGGFMGVAPTGREIALHGITILAFRDGRVVERWSQADMLGLMVQLGAVPPPAA